MATTTTMTTLYELYKEHCDQQLDERETVLKEKERQNDYC